jgi:histidyl-tRNA synthetase
MRAYLHEQQRLGSPFKAYYLTRMYRYSRPQAGRLREHRQFGVEVFGTDSPAADVEVLSVGNTFLRSLGLRRYRLEINSIGDDVCRPGYRAALIEYLQGRRAELRDEHKDRLEENPMRVLDCKDEACRRVAAEAPAMLDWLCDACRSHLDAVLAGAEAAGLEPIVTPTVVRGLDYYVRTAFEFVSDAMQEGGNAQQSTLFGGGRYDGMAEALGGLHVPGIGFGMGLERVLIALRDEDVPPPIEPPLDVYVVALSAAARDVAVQVVAELRSAGLSADLPYEERPMKAQLKMADRAEARFAAIVGDDEVAAGTVSMRRLADGTQATVSRDAVVAHARADRGAS